MERNINVFDEGKKSSFAFLGRSLLTGIILILSDFIYNKFQKVDMDEITLLLTLLALTIPSYFVSKWLTYTRKHFPLNENRNQLCRNIYLTLSTILIVIIGISIMIWL